MTAASELELVGFHPRVAIALLEKHFFAVKITTSDIAISVIAPVEKHFFAVKITTSDIAISVIAPVEKRFFAVMITTAERRGRGDLEEEGAP
jgi:hypothetical protein